MKILGISLALGDIYTGAGNGTIKYPLDGAIARFDAVAKAMPARNLSSDAFTVIVCTAGHDSKNPRRPCYERQTSLAKQLECFVREHRTEWVPRLQARPLCWSTRHEIRSGIRLACQVEGFDKKEPAEVIIASNLTHLVRIRLYTKLYVPKTWKAKLVVANHHFSFWDHLLEFPKLARDILYARRVGKRLARWQEYRKSRPPR